MGHKNHIRWVLRKITLQHRHHLFIHMINGGLYRQLPVKISQPVYKAKSPGCLLRHFNIEFVHFLRQSVADQVVRIEHLRMMPSSLQFFHNGTAGGIVSASGTA